MERQELNSQPGELPVVVGVVGGIASGKSNFTNALQSLGAKRIDADALAHQVLRRPLVVRRLSQLLSEDILVGNEIDRVKLAELVFPRDRAPTQALRHLEEVTHPLIHAEAVRQLSQYKADRKTKAVVIDAPLLIEAGWMPMCDVIVFVDTPDQVRFSRAQARGWSREHFQAREAAQLPLSEKRSAATHLVNGELEVDELHAYCAQLLEFAIDAKLKTKSK